MYNMYHRYKCDVYINYNIEHRRIRMIVCVIANRLNDVFFTL